MRLSPDTLTSEEGRRRVLALVKTHFRNNQYHIQFNVLDDKTLRDAQEKPENIGTLWSASRGTAPFLLR